MQIRELPSNISGNPLQAIVGYEVHVGQPFKDPANDLFKLTITDRVTGATLSNPLYIGSDGFFRNSSQATERVYPKVEEDAYSIAWLSPGSAVGSGATLYQDPNVESDAFGIAQGGSGSLVSRSINHFAQALTLDMTEDSVVYIQAYASGWQGTADGPRGAFYAYRTGSTGAAGTGNPGKFYDSAGNEFKPAPWQPLYIEMFGGETGVGSDNNQAANDMFDAARDLSRECSFGDGIYEFSTSTTTAPAYSLVNFYALNAANVRVEGTGNTTLKNTTANNNQFLFFAEDADTLSISGIKIDMNSTNASTGAIYCAGVLDADLDIKVENSGPCYFSASSTRQTGKVNINSSQFSSITGYAVSGDSGGFKELHYDVPVVTSAGGFIDLLNDDIDGFLLTFDDPVVYGGTLNADTVTTGYQLKVGSLYFENIYGSFTNLFATDLDTQDVTKVSGKLVDVTAEKVYTSTSTAAIGGGLVKSFDVGSVIARGCTSAIEIDDALQLVESFIVRSIDIDGGAGSNGLVLGDDTQLGKVRIFGGTFNSIENGIVINQTNGQKIEIRDTDLSGCTAAVTGMDKSSWRSTGVKGFTRQELSILGYTADQGRDPVGSYTLTYVRSNDRVEIVPGSYVVNSSSLPGTFKGIEELAMYRVDDSIMLFANAISTAGSEAMPAHDAIINLTKDQW